jgi:hypothetical protein
VEMNDWAEVAVAVLVPIVLGLVNSAKDRAVTNVKLDQQTSINDVRFKELDRIRDRADALALKVAKLEQKVEDSDCKGPARAGSNMPGQL